MFINAAKQAKNNDTADKLRLFRAVVKFLQDKHNPEMFLVEDVDQLMQHLTLSLTTKQVGFYEFLELAGLVDVIQTKGTNFAT